jgi:type II secretory pathway predicted ATPase ExeA
MYCDFYGMRERPFNVTADPRFLYLNARYREALASLNYGVTQRKGFVTLIGEAGTGKTTLLKKLLDDLDPATRTVFIFNTNVTFDEILEYTFSELDLPVHNGKRLYMLQRLNDYLLDELRAGRNVALLIDEAQDLDYSVLEDLRLLSNLETATEKILQIVLSGQPELAEKLGNPRLRQLRQRISVNCRLFALSREELGEYIRSRLAAAGCADAKLFSHEAEDRIFQISRGIPRLVNVLCDNALVIGYALGKKRIPADVVNEAATDLLPVERQDSDDEAAVAATPVEPAAELVQSSRRVPSLGIVAVVLVAIAVGLLSVGRTLLSPSGPMASPELPVASDVIRPGTRLAERDEAAVEPPPPRRRPGKVVVAAPVEAGAAAPAPQEEVRVRQRGEEAPRADALAEAVAARAKPEPAPEQRTAVGGTAMGAGWIWPPPRSVPREAPEPRPAAGREEAPLAALSVEAGPGQTAPEPAVPGAVEETGASQASACRRRPG